MTPDSVAHFFDERDAAIKVLLSKAIKAAVKKAHMSASADKVLPTSGPGSVADGRGH